MIVTLIVTARFVHIYNQIFNSCLKWGCLFCIKIFENSYSLQRANLGEHFLTTLQ
ncbi:hypothetical protein EC990741_0363 [Escherichia coli 97.0259]|nr:hypothetical protein PPECC33_00374 [Escherichia coli PCN033]EIH13403.1 hypothetical protein EC990741_0363 [Escherichia coli 97.0259]RCH08703.1 hypothetical protein CSC37_1892 [Escherichia coli]